MIKRKNAFLTFCFSLIPGCAEMYWGLMRQGLSLCTLFFGIIFVSVFLGIGSLMMVDLIVWLYAFFHARNMTAMTDEELAAAKDDYLFHGNLFAQLGRGDTKTASKALAVLLIAGGAYLLIRNLLGIISSLIPYTLYFILQDMLGRILQLLVAVGIIALGVRLIKGKAREMEAPDAPLSESVRTRPEQSEEQESQIEPAKSAPEQPAEEKPGQKTEDDHETM